MRSRSLLTPFFAALLFLVSCATANAHFIYVYSHDGQIKVVFGEGVEPDQAKFLTGLTKMKAFKVEDGKRAPIDLALKQEDELGWFETSIESSGHTVDVHCPYGVFGRGDKKMLLDYGAKYINLNAGKPSAPGSELAFDLVPEMSNGQLSVTAYFNGAPAKDIEIEVTRLEGDTYAQTDNSGHAVLSPNSRYVVKAKHSVAESGEVNGKQYTEKKYYCTLVVDTDPIKASDDSSVAAKTAKGPKLVKVEAELAEFPKGMTSFGATVLGDNIFVVGGKSGRAHQYAKSYQNREVFCLNFNDPSKNEWQSVGENLGLQGLAIVSHHGMIYRIGGLEARNKEDDDQDLHSTAEFLQFNPADKAWQSLPSLPRGRSSIDACVVGDHVYVAGGWCMGKGKPEWATTMLKFDLSKLDGQWEQIDVPFRTRALALREHDNKLFVIGGIQEKGGTTNEVHVYDLASGKWSEGPVVPTTHDIKAFGCSAASASGRLFVSTYEGAIFALNQSGDGWVKVHDLDAGRFFHQMLPVADNRFALVGGSHMETGAQFEVEVFEVATSDLPENETTK